MPFLHWEKEPYSPSTGHSKRKRVHKSEPAGVPKKEPKHITLRKECLRLPLVQYYYPFLSEEELKERGHQVVAEEQKEEQQLEEDYGGPKASKVGEILVVDELFLWLTCKKEPGKNGPISRSFHKPCSPQMRNLLIDGHN
jgi:hypothetical protein